VADLECGVRIPCVARKDGGGAPAMTRSSLSRGRISTVWPSGTAPYRLSART
jgi:hypothetical protein